MYKSARWKPELQLRIPINCSAVKADKLRRRDYGVAGCIPLLKKVKYVFHKMLHISRKNRNHYDIV